MKYLYYAILVIMVILSLAAGAAKVSNMPQEIRFFEEAGIGSTWMLPLGCLQIIGGLLAIYRRTRQAGSAVIAIGFLLSTFVIFATGNSVFGVFSLLPVLLCIFIFWRANGLSQSL
ncbi:hypothetical protein A8B75_13025 [Sphingomonadales bacterium EhC05]|nr:hypothetical protein A8B75_13025 [Sphingomonadales bacterium EhC05]